MIKLETKCEDCIMNATCKYKDHALHNMNRLKDTTYGDGPNDNDDLSWDTMMELQHVTITFSCRHFISSAKVRGVQ